jgi:hypothetical protein
MVLFHIFQYLKFIVRRNIGKFAPNQAKTALRRTVMVHAGRSRWTGTSLC